MKQKDIYYANLDPVKGSEQRGQRPVVILSGNTMNTNMNLCIICPITSKIKNIKWIEVVKRISVDGTLILRTESSENNLVLSPSIQKDFQLKIFIS